jgi:hypothetical protein
MGKNFVSIFTLVWIFCSCDDKRVILYEYKGVYVTRVDNNSESNFYYGNYKDDSNLPASYVKSTFSGFNSGMDAYLIFKPNKVEVYYSMGSFTNIGNGENIKVTNNPTSNTFNYNFDDKVRGQYDNVCRVSDILTREKELNATNHSKVNVTYADD